MAGQYLPAERYQSGIGLPGVGERMIVRDERERERERERKDEKKEDLHQR
jgi:hypothetical protein